MIDSGGCPANIFRFPPVSIFTGRLVQSSVRLIEQNKPRVVQNEPLMIFVVDGPPEFARRYPFFWTLGKIRRLDESAGEPRVFKGSAAQIVAQYNAALGHDPQMII